jgi:hypothetical protein
MAGTFVPIGFRINPWSVLCLLCNHVVARQLEDVPRCARCGHSYCPSCLAIEEESLRCAGDPADCPLRLAVPDPVAARARPNR